ncbi:unnamed protein product [Aureobasidium uvarum]|uniref:Uncharacterized protein n=1 Tax=Aureobasidium uvarum TaxID=2773716 RepID=A0A9N8KV49_9PEZI|nr:unnamed protein product [Aureobasidium uvarum]
MYLKPLEKLIKLRNANSTDEFWKGVFSRVPGQTVVLLIDFKGESQPTLNMLKKQLEPLRKLDYLTYWNGTTRVLRPLTIVASGKAKLSDIMTLDSSHRDIFFDAPLISLHSDVEDDFTMDPPTYKFNISNSYYASGELKDGVMARINNDESSIASQDASNGQLGQAQDRGLVSRYWGSAGPKYQTTEQIMWGFLIQVGMGILNMDDMSAVRDRTRGMGKLTIQE